VFGKRVVICVLSLASMMLTGRAWAGAPASGPARNVLLAETDYWRKHYTFLPPKVSAQAARAAGIGADPASRAKHIARFYHSGFATPPPPAGWAGADFDDASWLLSRGRQFVVGDGRLMRYHSPDHTSVYLRGTDPFVEEVGLICQRARFRVADRARAGQLKLSLTYRGGFVAYLNGREVARASLPAGPIRHDTPGDDYPLEAFFAAGSVAAKTFTPLHAFHHAKSGQWALRERTFGPRAIDASALRDGVNVLAIEMHRSDYPAECKRKKVNWRSRRSLGWSPVGLSLLELSAQGAPAAIAPMPARRQGVQVWTRDVTRPVGDRECPAPDEKLRPIRIVAARNGAFAGQVIASAVGGIKTLTATASALTRTGGGGTIPAAAVRIRYGAVNPLWRSGVSYLDAVLPAGTKIARPLAGRFDMLLDAPPAGVGAMAVWMTVRVPAEAPAGRYAGALTVRVNDAKAVEVPVDLSVADWALPDLADYGSLLNIYQSPDTLAAYYKVAPWSAAHWKLIDRSLDLMGGMGNIGLYFPLLAESQFGNPESMVVWTRKADGSYGYDFTAFDRYLATALKSHTRLKFLALCVWGYEARGRRGGKAYGARVTVLDPKTGKKCAMTLPEYGTAECEALWRPLLTAIAKRLAAKGLGKLIRLGLPADGSPPWQHVAMFRRILPEAAWIRESHFNINAFRYDPKDKKAVVPVAYNSIVWGGGVPDPAAKRLHGWRYNPRHIIMTFNRAGASALNLHGFARPWAFRMWMESTLAGGRNGNGRVGGDFWRIGMRPRGGSGRISSEAVGGCGGTLFGSYLPSAVGQVGLGNSTTDLFAPAPQGPVTTVRLENAREGNAEAEARIAIERALLDKARPLPAALAKRCRAILDERTNVLRMAPIGAGGIARYRWQDRTAALFAAAGDVAKALAAMPASAPAPAAKPQTPARR